MIEQRTRRVGGGPYREAEVASPRAQRRRAWRVALACATLATVAVVGWSGVRAWRRHTWAMGAGGRAAVAAHAGRLGGGEQVTVLRGEGENAEVVRVPGRLVRRGTDVVREVEVLPARDAVALMPDGAWAIDRRGNLFDVSSAAAIAGCARRPCVAQTIPGHGRVVQLTARGTARLEDGSTAWHPDTNSARWAVHTGVPRVVDIAAVEGRTLALLANGLVTNEGFGGTGEEAIPFEPGSVGAGLGVPDPTEITAASQGNLFWSPTSIRDTAQSSLVCVRGAGGSSRAGRSPRVTGAQGAARTRSGSSGAPYPSGSRRPRARPAPRSAAPTSASSGSMGPWPA